MRTSTKDYAEIEVEAANTVPGDEALLYLSEACATATASYVRKLVASD
jgi:hypothetical protein